MFFCCCQIMKYFYMKFKYNLITTKKYNEDRNFNSLNNFKSAFKLYASVPLNVCFNLTKYRSKYALI